MSELSPDDMELLDEMLALQQIDTFDRVSQQFTEIKDILAVLTVIFYLHLNGNNVQTIHFSYELLENIIFVLKILY